MPHPSLIIGLLLGGIGWLLIVYGSLLAVPALRELGLTGQRWISTLSMVAFFSIYFPYVASVATPSPSPLATTEASVAPRGGLTYKLIHRSPKPTQAQLATALPSSPPTAQTILTPAPQYFTAPPVKASPKRDVVKVTTPAAQPTKPLFSALDFRCQNGRTSTVPERVEVISDDALRMYNNHNLTQPFFDDVNNVEPSLSEHSTATCTITNYSQEPLYNLQVAVAWEIAQNNVAVTLKDAFPLYINRVEPGRPVTFRFANDLHQNVVVIAPTVHCFLELPGDTDYEKCVLTRFPHLEAHDPTWKYLKDPPTWMPPNFVIKK